MSGFPSTYWTVITKAREGDETALREFVVRYRAPIAAYCARRGLAAHAEDIAQEVFLQLFHGGVLTRADPTRGRFRSLLIAVTKNVIGHHARRECAEKRGGGQVQPLGDLDVATDAQDEDFDREWVAHLVEVALARLACAHPNYHEALKRFLLSGQSHAEIASALGKSEGEVKNYVHRGRAKLVEYLRDEVREYSQSHAEYEDELQYLSRFLPRT